MMLMTPDVPVRVWGRSSFLRCLEQKEKERGLQARGKRPTPATTLDDAEGARASKRERVAREGQGIGMGMGGGEANALAAVPNQHIFQLLQQPQPQPQVAPPPSLLQQLTLLQLLGTNPLAGLQAPLLAGLAAGTPAYHTPSQAPPRAASEQGSDQRDHPALP
jgi:hypothetical protein